MGLNYTQLNEAMRRFMLQEWAQGGHYISPRLNDTGRARWVGLLKDALQYHTDVWLERELIRRNCFVATEFLQSTITGKAVTRAINKEQLAKTLAEGEFNRFFLRALCLAAKTRGYKHLVVTQGRIVPGASPAIKQTVGRAVDAATLLTGLRESGYKQIDAALGAPEGMTAPAYLTARLPDPGEAFALHKNADQKV